MNNVKEEYVITVKLGRRELASLHNLNQHNSCIYNADLNEYEVGVAALVSTVVRGNCAGYEEFVEDYENSAKEEIEDETV